MEENKSINRSNIQKNLYNALVESYNSDKDIITSYGDVVTLKRGRDDQDKDEDPSAGSNRGSKRRRSGKEAKLSKEPTHKESKSTSSSKGASRSQLTSSGKSAYAEEHGQKDDDLEDQIHQEFNTGNDDVTHVREALDDDESQWNPSSSPTPDHEWHKTKIVDNRPPQPWITQMAQAAVIWKRLLFEDRTIIYTSLEKANLKDFVDIEDMLLLFVQSKLSNLNLEERYALNIEMDYLPKRKWSKQDKQRARVMINAIDKKLKDRRLMRNVEKFVGGRPYGGDLRLLERTI
nr:hypothetical protein [Tanacetum cinerariifolium]